MTVKEATKIHTSCLREYMIHFCAGEQVLLTGTLYTVWQSAHQRLCALLDRKMPLPIPIENSIFFYAAPAPGREDRTTVACGPATARELDQFTPRLFRLGLGATIGKGDRGKAVEISIREHATCHFAAVGGVGALLAQCIVKMEPVAFPELGCEAIYRLEVRDFPVIVAIDCRGGNIYRNGKSIYRQV